MKSFFFVFVLALCAQTAFAQNKLDFQPNQITELSIYNGSEKILEGKLSEITRSKETEETITFFATLTAGDYEIPIKIKMWPPYGHFYIYWGKENVTCTLKRGTVTMDKVVTYSTQDPMTGQNPGDSPVIVRIKVQK